jgi:hypothetical protein
MSVPFIVLKHQDRRTRLTSLGLVQVNEESSVTLTT